MSVLIFHFQGRRALTILEVPLIDLVQQVSRKFLPGSQNFSVWLQKVLLHPFVDAL